MIREGKGTISVQLVEQALLAGRDAQPLLQPGLEAVGREARLRRE